MIFVDTWAWLALAVKRDQYHAAAKAQHQNFLKASRKYVTTDHIVSELVSSLYRTGPVLMAQGYVEALLAKADAGDYILVHVSSDQFRQSWQMRKKYHDKPDISFVDFTSMVVMQDLGITDVFTGDAHFQQVNLGFQLHP
jgi:predicted nucleic acid-binding protein